MPRARRRIARRQPQEVPGVRSQDRAGRRCRRRGTRPADRPRARRRRSRAAGRHEPPAGHGRPDAHAVGLPAPRAAAGGDALDHEARQPGRPVLALLLVVERLHAVAGDPGHRALHAPVRDLRHDPADEPQPRLPDLGHHAAPARLRHVLVRQVAHVGRPERRVRAGPVRGLRLHRELARLGHVPVAQRGRRPGPGDGPGDPPAVPRLARRRARRAATRGRRR